MELKRDIGVERPRDASLDWYVYGMIGSVIVAIVASIILIKKRDKD